MEGSGGLLGAFGVLLGTFWAPVCSPLDAPGHRGDISWASWVHLGPSGVDFGLHLEGFGEGLGRIWEGFGSIWAPFGVFLGPIWAALGSFVGNCFCFDVF